jgi:hypothetical protein
MAKPPVSVGGAHASFTDPTAGVAVNDVGGDGGAVLP